MSKIYQKKNLNGKNPVKRVLGGFTLVELLVVVLIIGILAAIALPKYQTAVEKARISQVYVMAKHFKDAEEMYRMANGEYTASFEELGIDIPAGYTLHTDGSLSDNKSFTYSLLRNYDRVLVTGRNISLSIKLASEGGGRVCCAYAQSNYRGEKLCRSLGGQGSGSAQCSDGSCRCWDLP